MPSVATIYIIATTAIFIYTAHDHLTHCESYFKAMMTYLADQKCVFILYNMILSLAILFYRAFTAIFFVNILEGEILKITDKLKNKILDLIILAYIIDLKFNFQMYLLVVFVTFTFILHNHLIFRSEYLVHVHTTSSALGLHYRAIALYLVLFFVDYQMLKYIFKSMLSVSQATQALFVYYMITNAFSLLEPFMQFAIDFYQKYTFTHIKNSDEIIATASIFINLPRLTLELILCVWMSLQFKQVFFAIIRGFEIVSNIKKTYESYSRIKKLSETMTRLKKLSGVQLEQFHDLTCTVCYQDMKESVLLPCRHIFHEECIRQWIIKNLNHFCPKCKHELNFENADNIYVQKKKQTPLDRMRQMIERQETGRFNNQANFSEGDKRYEEQFQRQQNNDNYQQEASAQHLQRENSREKRSFQRQKYEDELPQQSWKNKTAQRQFQHERTFKQRFSPQKERVQVVDRSGRSIPLKQYIIERPDLSEMPLQVYESMRRKIVGVGSMPFSMPAMAISHRTAAHMSKREEYMREMQIITRLMEMSRNQQLLLL